MDTYIGRNTLNGKFYIGSSVDFEKRKKQHLESKANYPFQNALRKNPEAFEWEVYTDDSENRELEQALLDMFYGTEMCYNLNPIANEPPRYEWTEERRKAMGDRARERGTDHLRTPEAIEKMKETKRITPTVYTEEMRKARSERLRGNSNKKGKKESEETCRKKSKAFTGLKKPGQTLAMKGRTWWIHPDGARKFQVDSPGSDWVNSYGLRNTFKRTDEDIRKIKERNSLALKGRRHWVNARGERKFQHESPGPEWQNGRVYRPDT